MGGHLEPTDECAVLTAAPTDVGGEHEDLGTEAVGDLADQLGPGDGRGVDADLVRAAAQQAVDVLDRADAATDGQRDEDLLSGAGDDVIGGRSIGTARGDVEEGQLVGSLSPVASRELDRVTGVAEVLEVDALDDAAGVDVETGDDTNGEGHACSLLGYVARLRFAR